MYFNSYEFVVFFIAVLLGYFMIPKKLRYVWLLAASYYFYMQWNAKYSLLLLFSTAVTYCASILIDRFRKKKQNRAVNLTMVLSLSANLFILAYFKYANFLIESFNRIFQTQFSLINVLLPVGISFYIFQAIGYTVDVYRGKTEPERNFLRYALFVSFFPQLVAGPIEKSGNLLPQLKNIEHLKLWNWKRIQSGLLIILYGLILKMIISDRAALIVDLVFRDTPSFEACAQLLAAFLFAVQIYCDFAGYTYIAIGVSRVMGIELMNNFNSPYLAHGIKDFWNRWHISLSSWFKEYLYIPLGGSRKGKLKKYLNLFIVFTVSGLWHGASWHFVLWGMIHAVLRIIEEITDSVKTALHAKLKIRDDCFALRLFSTVLTFVFVTLALVFFRAYSVSQGVTILKNIFTGPYDFTRLAQPADYIRQNPAELAALAVFIVLLLISDLLREKGFHFDLWFENRSWLFRALFFILLIVLILTFGVYGPDINGGAFIYFQF